MQISNFDQLFEEVALKLFQDYQNSVDFLDFLQKKLPLKYGFEQGVLVNRKKEIAVDNFIFYDSLNCPQLITDLPSAKKIIPANYAYGSLSFFPIINQESLENGLQQNELLNKVYEGQNTHHQLDRKPLNIWLATDLAPFLSLNDLEDRLLAELHPPECRRWPTQRGQRGRRGRCSLQRTLP